MHKEAFDFANATLRGLELPSIRALEIGARDFNGGMRGVVETMQPEWYVGIDVAPGVGVDAVADGADFEPEAAPNLIICTEVLEHTPHAKDVVYNMGRILDDGGVALITCATDPRAPHSAVDGGPIRDGEYYGNVGGQALFGWMIQAGLEVRVLEVHEGRGDLYALGVRPRLEQVPNA